MGFSLNRAIPGSTCQCGHNGCYHEPEKMGTSVAREEFDELKNKFELLQEELGRVASRSAFDRVPRLEEQVDNNKVDADAEFKRINQAIAGVYYHIGLLKSRAPYYEDHIEALHDNVQKIESRVIDVDDACMKVEDRVEVLERSNPRTTAPFFSCRRKASTPPSPGDDPYATEDSRSEESVAGSRAGRSQLHYVKEEEASKIQSFRERVSSVGSGSQAWTVHVSLLPSSSQPFPFEKDTAAYKRCLSRGLHQVIVIPDTDSRSFKSAVEEAFSDNLRGRPWQPLVARLCDAQNLLGLPMIRQLPPHLIGGDYNADFLRDHCSVNDQSGKILDLYIAMSEHTISWAELKLVPPYKQKLEDAWIFDPLLDGPSAADVLNFNRPGSEPNRPAAGDILPSWSSTLKRNASEMSRTPSFGSSNEAENNRAKLRRQCTNSSVEVIRQRGEVV